MSGRRLTRAARGPRHAAWLVLAGLSAAGPAGPQDPHEHGPGEGRFLRGARHAFEANGLSLGGSLIVDASHVVTGGVRRHGALRGLFGAHVDADLERTIGLDGATLFAGILWQAGRDGSRDTGDLQVYSNIDNPDMVILSGLWYEQRLFQNLLRIKIGKFDANHEFALVEAGLDFLHSSPGSSPALVVFPSYPDPAAGASVFGEPVAGLHVRAGVFNAMDRGPVSARRGLTARFDEVFAIVQAGLHWNTDGAGLPGRVALGGWHQSGRFDRFGGGVENGTEGVYVIVEQTVHRPEGGTAEDGGGLTLFVQYGFADEDVHVFTHHGAAGAFWRGWPRDRPRDSSGAMVSFVDLSDAPGAGFGRDETAIEVFHRFQVTDSLAVQPAAHWILDPGGRQDVHDASVLTLRVQFDF